MRQHADRFLSGVYLCGLICAATLSLVAEETTPTQPAAQGTELGNLARLARLEQLNGNGGAEEGSALTAGYDKKDGFHIQDKEGMFLLKIKFQLQPRYTFKARDTRGDQKEAAVVPGGPFEVGKEDDSFFELERARIVLEGHVLDPDLTFKIQFDGDTDSADGVQPLDTYIEYWGLGELMAGEDQNNLIGLGVGQFKPYFMRQEATSSTSLLMVDRSLTNEFFNIDRNLGAWVRGDVGDNVYYAFAVTNGWDSINVAPGAVDNIPAFIGKLDFQLWGDPVSRGKYAESNHKQTDLFVVGLSLASDANNGSSGTGGLDYKAYQFGIDAAFKAGPFSFQTEYVGRWIDYEIGNTAIPGGIGSAQYAHGAYAQAGIFLIQDTLELAGRVSTVWCDGPQDGNGVEAGPGLNWYISKSHNVKWQTDVMFFDISPNLQDSSEDLDRTGSTASSFSSSAAQLQAGEQGVMIRTQIQLSF